MTTHRRLVNRFCKISKTIQLHHDVNVEVCCCILIVDGNPILSDLTWTALAVNYWKLCLTTLEANYVWTLWFFHVYLNTLRYRAAFKCKRFISSFYWSECIYMESFGKYFILNKYVSVFKANFLGLFHQSHLLFNLCLCNNGISLLNCIQILLFSFFSFVSLSITTKKILGVIYY